ncbi:hypothetical protein KFU94_40025 [Chloroflexi bacterium TSY]|nr:hypothetical protein [Chloroflexi bacterium TSY]
MDINYIPTLQVLQELYEKPRDMDRFQWYLRQMLGENEEGEQDVVLPIAAANPMGREHCLAAVNALIEIGAEAVAQQSFEEASYSFADLPQTVHAVINLLDDIGGGWTNRYLSEGSFRIVTDPRTMQALQKRPIVLVACWSSETYQPADIRAEARAALYRYVHLQRQGVPSTLQQIMTMDGLARAFAGVRPQLDQDELSYTAEVIAPFLLSTNYAEQFACLFGDEAARNVGYTPQGVAPYAGFELALQETIQNERGIP